MPTPLALICKICKSYSINFYKEDEDDKERILI